MPVPSEIEDSTSHSVKHVIFFLLKWRLQSPGISQKRITWSKSDSQTYLYYVFCFVYFVALQLLISPQILLNLMINVFLNYFFYHSDIDSLFNAKKKLSQVRVCKVMKILYPYTWSVKKLNPREWVNRSAYFAFKWSFVIYIQSIFDKKCSEK